MINLGTNDFSTMVDPTQAEFEAAYVALLERIRAVYPDAVILCTLGPGSGAEHTTPFGYITNAVQARVAQGDAKVTTFELPPTNSSDGYGCDWHPSLLTHQRMADALVTTLRSELGW